ncbi:hypothetical protein D1631_05660 [Chryseobacterium nematophagum]|uniref:Uncharacterized protein n=1 Tax=Chryseobacterium nematophagum TaxID=2305228 RepID=A0A3M7TD80_9FLAO|nr:hypothetical protein [Chryseobacterium nematophagum]RNA61455.1 hypothetical protein D1631_05660 [Chryseobacterium nematophagum]
MNYLELLCKFWEHNQRIPFGASATVIYNFLLHKWYQKNCEDFILADTEIIRDLKLSYKTIRTSREKLRNQGLIQYHTQNGLPSLYKIITDYSILSEKQEHFNAKRDTKRPKENTSSNAFPSKSITGKNSFIKGSTSATILTNNVNQKIPSFNEFLSFAKTIKNYTSDLDLKIEAKYDSWIENEWKNGNDRPITNWRSTLKNTMPYIIDSKPNNPQVIKLQTLPQIKRPKSTYNE